MLTESTLRQLNVVLTIKVTSILIREFSKKITIEFNGRHFLYPKYDKKIKAIVLNEEAFILSKSSAI